MRQANSPTVKIGPIQESKHALMRMQDVVMKARSLSKSHLLMANTLKFSIISIYFVCILFLVFIWTR